MSSGRSGNRLITGNPIVQAGNRQKASLVRQAKTMIHGRIKLREKQSFEYTVIKTRFSTTPQMSLTDYSFGKSVRTSNLCMTLVIFPTIVYRQIISLIIHCITIPVGQKFTYTKFFKCIFKLLVVTVLSHCCNSRTDSGEARVESHASSETQPTQAALLLNTARIQPGSQPHQFVGGNTVHLATWSACTAPCPPQESREETRISLPAKPSLTQTMLGQL